MATRQKKRPKANPRSKGVACAWIAKDMVSKAKVIASLKGGTVGEVMARHMRAGLEREYSEAVKPSAE